MLSTVFLYIGLPLCHTFLSASSYYITLYDYYSLSLCEIGESGFHQAKIQNSKAKYYRSVSLPSSFFVLKVLVSRQYCTSTSGGVTQPHLSFTKSAFLSRDL